MNSTERRSLISGLTLRLLVVGIPKHTINPLVDLIVRWVTCSGEEWTVRRLKAIKQSIITKRAGLIPDYPLAKNKKGQVKGVVGYLMRYAVKSDNNFVKVINAFMAYSHWTSSRMTRTQRTKFLKAVTSASGLVPGPLRALIQRATREVIQSRTVNTVPTPLVMWNGSPVKRAPTLHGSVSQDSSLLGEVFLTRNRRTWDHISNLWSPIYQWVFKGVDVHQFVDGTHDDDITNHPMVGGEVHFLQEAGYKLRSIASPYRLFQVASEPLKNDLKVVINQLPWDCTHCQGRAFQPIQEAIGNAKVIHSVDLSSATDYFPFELQEIVLQTIYGKDSPYVQLVRDVSRAHWHSEIGYIKWSKGQPLGFNPSFFLFTLTHGLLLYGLNGYKWEGEFYVVGDDVVILSDMLYRQYINVLTLLGCPYSPDKSINSNKLAEFAGKLIIKDLVIPQLKWRGISDDNFIDIARLVGPRIRSLLSKKQRKVLDVFAHIPDFIHPYGLNWSYPGSNLSSMIKAGMELSLEETVLSSLTGLSTRVHKQLYAAYGSYTNDLVNIIRKDDIENEIKTFDEKVCEVFRKLGWHRRNSYETFLEGLRDIPETHARLHLQPRMLPLEVRPPGRETLLHRLFRFLQFRHQGTF